MKQLSFAIIGIFLWGSAAYADAYFEASHIPPTLLPVPPAEDSAVYQANLNEILELQKVPDTEKLAKAAAERDLKPEMVALAVDASLTRDRFPALYTLLDNVSDTSRPVVKAHKEFWNTKRPWQADSRVKALIEVHANPSYPSGHSTGSALWAAVLGQLLPDKNAQFRARAEEIGFHRKLTGMHFEHDVEGGRKLSLILIGALLETPAFQADFAKAKQELAGHK